MENPESNQDFAHKVRLAQTNRLLRYCEEQGWDSRAVMAGELEVDLSPIHGADGTIRPEEVDYRAVSGDS